MINNENNTNITNIELDNITFKNIWTTSKNLDLKIVKNQKESQRSPYSK